jgi:LysM repeat protein
LVPSSALRLPIHDGALVFGGGLSNLGLMWKAAFAAVAVLGMAVELPAQSIPIELANLREDVRLLAQRTGELALRVEQLERENAELRRQTAGDAQSYATVVQVNEAVAELNRAIRTATAGAKNETLQQVSVQMEKLAKQTNAAIDSLAKGMATRATVQTTFSEDFSKEGISYTVQRGDTLAVIARNTGAKVQDIINANKISDPSKIQVGQTLFIPGGK